MIISTEDRQLLHELSDRLWRRTRCTPLEEIAPFGLGESAPLVAVTRHEADALKRLVGLGDGVDGITV